MGIARTLGTIDLAGGDFAIDCEPHVRMRLKRYFARIHEGSKVGMRLSATPENARELHVFCTQLFPMTVTPAARAVMDARRTEYVDNIRALEELIDPNYVAPPFNLALPPRSYQAQSAAILLRRGFLLNADDLGLGKTMEAICTFTDPRALPAIVVTYPHLQRQWVREIEKFAPNLTAHVLKQSTPYELPKEHGRGPDVVITTYHKLDGWRTVLRRYARSVSFDEVQELRRHKSAKYEAARSISEKMKFRGGYSATPVYNYGGEMFNILDVLNPDGLGTWEEFAREWCGEQSKDREKARIENPAAFGSYLRDNFFMLRRTRADVGRELPAVIRIPHEIEADTAELDRVKDSASELARIILRQSESFRGQKMQAAEKLSNLLRQATGIAKAPYVAEFVKMLVASGKKVLLAGWHHAVYEIWRSRLAGDANHPIRLGWYTGHESPKQKDETAARMMAGEIDVLIISLRAGAGLDGIQTVCHTLVIGELDWSPGVHQQLIGRLNRDGQDEAVRAYFLVADEGSDPIIADVLGVKKNQSDGVRDPNRDLVEKLDRGEDNIRRLAEAYLNGNRTDAPAPAPRAPIAVPPRTPPQARRPRFVARVLTAGGTT